MLPWLTAIGAAVALAPSNALAQSATPAPAPAPAPAVGAAEETHGPANNIVFEAMGGYGVAAFTAIAGHDPTVAHGPMFHTAVGWAFALGDKQSIGVLAFADGTFDGDHSTRDGTKLASRIGAAAALWGSHAHLRLGFGFAHATLDGNGYGGLGVAFAAGLHVGISEFGKKRGVFMVDVLPAWDFLGAGNETLNRPSFGIMIGVAVL
jgi:hypothetical protein